LPFIQSGYLRLVIGRGDQLIREHISTVARRDPRDYAVLAEALHSVTWPDAGIDRRHPDAQAWFQRYMHLRGPGPMVIPPSCGCAIGRCLVCN
jgi:hypothetical protein